MNLKGKKSKKEPRVKEKEVEKKKEENKEKVQESKENIKKESVQELEKEVEQETKEINKEVETELKKTSAATLVFTQAHQENFGIDPTPSKQKVQKEKAPTLNTTTSKKEHQPSKNYHTSDTTNFNPYQMFPYPPYPIMPNVDNKGGQTPYVYMYPVPVDPSQFPKDYFQNWQNMGMYFSAMQNNFQSNFNKQNSNSKK
jgi:hypothetical protein